MNFKENLFFQAYMDDLYKQVNLLLDEFLYLSFVINYFKRSIDKNYHRGTFEKFWRILRSCDRKIEKILKIIEDLEDLNVEKEYYKVFVKILSLKAGIEYLLEEFDFIQKKFLSYQSGSQQYYPLPKVSCSRESLKTHKYMEYITEDFLRILGIEDFDVLMFWDYSPYVQFLDGQERTLVINTDFSLPHRQSYWIILFHEVFHYISNAIEKEDRDFMKIKPLRRVFNDFNSLVEDTIHACRLALIREGIKTPIDSSAIKDILIDSLLTKLFGAKFLIPISTRLFVFDEDDFDLPHRRTWRVRLLSIASAFVPRNRKEKEYKKGFKEFLDEYHKQQVIKTKNLLKEDFFIEEAILVSVIKRTLFSGRMTRILSQFEKILKRLRSKEFALLSTYFDYSNIYVERFLDSLINRRSFKKEGRTLCFSFQELDVLAKRERKKREIIENGFNLKVFRIKLFKLRFDLDKSPFEEFAENSNFLYAIGLSHFNLFTIENRDIYEKVDIIEDLEDKLNSKFLNTRKLLFENTNKNVEVYSFEDFLLKKGIAFYEESLNLTLFNLDNQGSLDESILNRLEEVIKEQSKYIFILMKMKTKTKKTNRESSDFRYLNIKQEFEKLKGSFRNEGIEEFDIFVFSSYDWFDYCVLVALRLGEGEVKLSSLLKHLKKDLILRNDELSRTETSIFAGKNLDYDRVKLPRMNILIRIAGEDLGKSWSFIESLIENSKKDFNIISSFGMRDLILQLIGEISFNRLLEIFSDIYKIANEEQIKISDIQIEPMAFWNLSLNVATSFLDPF